MMPDKALSGFCTRILFMAHPGCHRYAPYCGVFTRTPKKRERKHPIGLIPEEGLEPSIPCEKRILNPPRLPIPPLRLGNPCMMANVGPNRKLGPIWEDDGKWAYTAPQ